ncbi:MAG: hypothetical protein JWL77_5910 [Chthonomonadaceae bacterium]|nr:hypothetical protein [Chthonomonadaceae bacterium]
MASSFWGEYAVRFLLRQEFGEAGGFFCVLMERKKR